jgi:hypothetical protein
MAPRIPNLAADVSQNVTYTSISRSPCFLNPMPFPSQGVFRHVVRSVEPSNTG